MSKKKKIFIILCVFIGLIIVWRGYTVYNADYINIKKMAQKYKITERQKAEYLKSDSGICSNSDRSLMVNLVSNSRSGSIEPIKFKIPKSYLSGQHNRKSGDRNFVRVDAELDDLSPRCLRYQNSSEENEPSSQPDKKSFSTKLTRGREIDPTYWEEQVYTEFFKTDKYGYDLYSKKLSQEYIERYGMGTYYLKIPQTYQGLTKYVTCMSVKGPIKNSTYLYKDEFNRILCLGYFNYQNEINVQYHFFHEHLNDLEMLESKVIQLVEKFKK